MRQLVLSGFLLSVNWPKVRSFASLRHTFFTASYGLSRQNGVSRNIWNCSTDILPILPGDRLDRLHRMGRAKNPVLKGNMPCCE